VHPVSAGAEPVTVSFPAFDTVLLYPGKDLLDIPLRHQLAEIRRDGIVADAHDPVCDKRPGSGRERNWRC